MTHARAFLPYRPFAIAILLRGSVIWLAVRVAMYMSSGIRGADRSTGWDVLISACVVALVIVLVRLDLARLNERLFLANLGVRTAVLTALGALPPVALEAAFAALAP